ncbi:hypothetical protein C8J56DRAFT_898373 [Mycena floridula]|nr:hypothetical protein C8J56DRAFT_898373 [Mycena floridula]
MPRRQLYFTAEEKQEANRAKKRRFYSRHVPCSCQTRIFLTSPKRHREDILDSLSATRREKRVQEQKKKLNKAKKSSLKDSETAGSPGPAIAPAQYWVDRAALLPSKILKVLSPNPKTFTRYVCDRICRAQRNQRPFSVEAQLIEEALARLNQLQRLARQYSRAMLQITGVNEDFCIVEKHSNSVDLAIKWVEDISMGILGEDDFIESRRQGKFLFQKGDFVF